MGECNRTITAGIWGEIMHNLYFVYLGKDEKIKSSSEARRRVNGLLESNSFAGGEGYWGGGKADWFVIGGRWSGILSKLLGKKPKSDRQHIKEEVAHYGELRLGGGWWGNLTQQEFDKEVSEHIKNEQRNAGKLGGYPDDAMRLDKKLLAAMQTKKGENSFIRECELFHAGSFEEEDVSCLDKKDLGGWIVVIDYHY